jgi:hypothetical protein
LAIPPNGSIQTIVKLNSVVVQGATVVVNAGPAPPNLAAPNTDSAGSSIVAAASGATNYTVTVSKYGQSVSSAGFVVATGVTKVVNVALQMGTLTVNAKRRTTPTVCVADGVTSISLVGPGGWTVAAGNSSGTGSKSFLGQPIGSYTITATYSGSTGTATATVNNGLTTTVTVTTAGSPACP